MWMAQQPQETDASLSSALRQKAHALELEIRERKRIEDVLHESERRRDEFLATLAHELRNPLAPMRNATEIMKVADADPARMAAARALIERQLAHLVRLIDDLLDVSRITRGRLELRIHRTDLMTALDMALETTRPLVERKRHRLRVEVTGAPLIVDGDVTRLAQVLSTLIDNSALYSDPESPITVTLTRDATDAILTVSDRGIGIAPELLPWVFDMFARPSPPCIGARSGLGIGLTLVKRLVELHGGNIEAHSGGLNRGSTFTVRLPLAVDATDGTPVGGWRPVYGES
jgi:signal transduction histidine kinase